MDGETSGAVMGPESATGDTNISPDVSGAPPEAAPQSGASDQGSAPVRSEDSRGIPRERFNEAVQRERARAQALEQKLAAMEAKFNEASSGWNNFSESMLRGLGLKEDPKPEYIERKSLDETITSLKREFAERMQMGELKLQLKEAEQKYADSFSYPGFKDHVLNEWSRNPDKDLLSIAAEADKTMKAKWAAREQKYAEEKEKTAQTQPIKSGGAAKSSPPPKLHDRASRVAAVISQLKSRGGSAT